MPAHVYSEPEKDQRKSTKNKNKEKNPVYNLSNHSVLNTMSKIPEQKAPPVPRRKNSIEDTFYEYDPSTVEHEGQPMYEIPGNDNLPDFSTDSLDSELSDLMIIHEKSGMKFWGKILFFSLLFGFLGGLIGGLLINPQNNAAESAASGGNSGCSCTTGHVFFSYANTNTDSCYAVANGSLDKNGARTPNLLQKNGLFVRAGEANLIGNVEEASVNLDSVVFSTNAHFNSQLPTIFSENGEGEENGFFLSQAAVWGITGSSEGKNVMFNIDVNITTLSQEETKPVAIRLLPLICIG